MSEGQQYLREKNGKRFALKGGLNTVISPDLVPDGQFLYLQNVRARLMGRIVGRPTMGSALYTAGVAPHTIVRINDAITSALNTSGYVRVVGAAGLMYVAGSSLTGVASGFSGNPLSVISLEPNQSVQPWAYIGDSSTAVTITATGQTCTGMVKLRSDGLVRKSGIEEPQLAPTVGINTTTVTQWLTLPANTPPWTNIGGANANYNYSGTDTQPPYPATILTPVGGATVTLTVTGTAQVDVNGVVGSHAPGDSGSTGVGAPGDFIITPLIVVFAFTDSNGNIIAQSTVMSAPPVVGNVGTSATLTVPAGAAQLQIGIDSPGGHFSSNSDSYLIEAVVSTSAITQVSSIVGLINAYIWGDSPHSGSVANYIWRNPSDGGTGIARTIGTAAATANNNSLIMDSSPEDGTVPVIWTTLNSAGATVGSIDLFSPALESDGYQDFNACITGSIFVPAGGTYAIQIQNKDQIMFGIGGRATSTGGAVYGPVGQAITVVSGWPLLYVSVANGEGGAVTQTIQVTFPALGVYPFEIDWDYWDHSGRSLIVEMAATAGGSVALIPPLPQGVRQNVSYAYKYRASETGAQSNPSPNSTPQQTPVLANTVTSVYSLDPQVTKVDYYRQDSSLANYTYVATGPNDGLGGTVNGITYNTPIEDTLSDIGAANNQIMQLDDFEPFPSIGNPLSGYITIVDGVINWLSGNQFPLNMLPGTLMLIGSPTQLAYSLVSRPISATQIVIPDVPDAISGTTVLILSQVAVSGVTTTYTYSSYTGPTPASGMTMVFTGFATHTGNNVTAILTGSSGGASGTVAVTTTTQVNETNPAIGTTGIPYNIATPILAQQPMPSMWGPDAYGFVHGCGDTNQPGAYVWTKAYNPDSAPQTNRLLLTSPSETLMGGGLVNGISMVFSTLRAWLMYPNFADAQATTEGISGNQWNPILAVTSRGLYIRNCLCSIGGKALAFRAPDGISVTSGGGEQSITDETLYNLFPHENFTPTTVTIGPYIIYPPNDNLPQKLSYQNGYIYWDYQDVSSNYHTLVYDEAGKGWSVDVGVPNFTAHAPDYAPGVSDTAVGCSDNTIRVLSSTGTEAAISVVATGADNSGDARAFKRIGDVFIKAIIAPSNPIAVALYTNQYALALSGFSPVFLGGSGSLASYIVDWTSGQPQDVIDLDLALSWNTSNIWAPNELDLWQSSLLSLPETTQDRASDWTDLGTPGNKFFIGLTLELNTFNTPKTFVVQDETYATHALIETPITANGQTIRTFTFITPFTAHQVRIVSTDGVAWQFGPTNGWRLSWDAKPYPEKSTLWTTEGLSHGLLGWQHIYLINLMYVATQPVTVTLNTDQGVFTQTWPAAGTIAVPAKIIQKMPRNKFKVCSYAASSTAAFYLFKEDVECFVKSWGSSGPYVNLHPFGGPSGEGAEL